MKSEMDAKLREFGNIAIKLSRNPLGTIGLFQVLVYAIAGLVVGLRSSNSTALEPLIWFLSIFPVLLLISFTYLVSKHHQKLYAPNDFSDDAAFLEVFDKGIRSSASFLEMKNLSSEVQRIVGENPLFVFARLSPGVQFLLKSLHGRECIVYEPECVIEEVQFRFPDDLRDLEEKHGWITLKGNTVQLTEKGKKDLGGFLEMLAPRML